MVLTRSWLRIWVYDARELETEKSRAERDDVRCKRDVEEQRGEDAVQCSGPRASIVWIDV